LIAFVEKHKPFSTETIKARFGNSKFIQMQS